MDKLLIKQYPPEIDAQIKWVAAYIVKLRESIETDKQDWMEEDLRHQQAIYQTLCMAKWMIELCTKDLLNVPGNQPTKQHNACWIPFFLVSDRRWTIVKVSRGVGTLEYHPLGDVATEAEAIDWADNENYSDFDLDDKEIIADILKGTAFEKEVHHG